MTFRAYSSWIGYIERVGERPAGIDWVFYTAHGRNIAHSSRSSHRRWAVMGVSIGRRPTSDRPGLLASATSPAPLQHLHKHRQLLYNNFRIGIATASRILLQQHRRIIWQHRHWNICDNIASICDSIASIYGSIASICGSIASICDNIASIYGSIASICDNIASIMLLQNGLHMWQHVQQIWHDR